MRIHFKSETFPSREEILLRFKDSKHYKDFEDFINIYYNTLVNVSKVYGFSLLRLDFIELTCIIHRVSTTLIIELKKL